MNGWVYNCIDRKELCDNVFEKIRETRVEAVEAVTRLAHKFGATAGEIVALIITQYKFLAIFFS